MLPDLFPQRYELVDRLLQRTDERFRIEGCTARFINTLPADPTDLEDILAYSLPPPCSLLCVMRLSVKLATSACTLKSEREKVSMSIGRYLAWPCELALLSSPEWLGVFIAREVGPAGDDGIPLRAGTPSELLGVRLWCATWPGWRRGAVLMLLV